MSATQTADLLQRLRRGVFDPSDTLCLDQESATRLVAELRLTYRLTFQERRLRNKWEVSLARSLRAELAARPIRDSLLFSLVVVPVYVDCLMLSIEDDAITGISRLTRLRVRPTRKPTPGLALTTGRGFKLDRSPDGWAMKPLQKRTVKLSEGFLRDRGWRFDQLNQLLPTS